MKVIKKQQVINVDKMKLKKLTIDKGNNFKKLYFDFLVRTN